MVMTTLIHVVFIWPEHTQHLFGYLTCFVQVSLSNHIDISLETTSFNELIVIAIAIAIATILLQWEETWIELV
jgi:hypothetical protein